VKETVNRADDVDVVDDLDDDAGDVEGAGQMAAAAAAEDLAVTKANHKKKQNQNGKKATAAAGGPEADQAQALRAK